MAPQPTQQSYPPHHFVASKPISQSEAQSLLAAYLASTLSSPHLHPDAVLSPGGAQFSPHGGAQGGLALHNLRRVEAGLRGETLEPDAAEVLAAFVVPEEENEFEKSRKKRRKDGDASTEAAFSSTKASAEGVAAAEEGWQDPEEYQRQQAEEEGELGERDNFVAQVDEKPPIMADGEADTTGVTFEETAVDKAARKKNKKERKKEKQREKNTQKRKAVEGGEDSD